MKAKVAKSTFSGCNFRSLRRLSSARNSSRVPRRGSSNEDRGVALTTEQIIVFGFIVAAFLAGWIASVITRRRGRALAEEPPPAPPVESLEGTARATAPPLAEEVGQALRSDAANEEMFSVVRTGGDPALSELELDLADWGFTYGVAWARARERAPGGPDEAVAREALDAAERVFRAYTGGDDWTQRAIGERSNGNGPEGQNGSG